MNTSLNRSCDYRLGSRIQNTRLNKSFDEQLKKDQLKKFIQKKIVEKIQSHQEMHKRKFLKNVEHYRRIEREVKKNLIVISERNYCDYK